MHEIELALDRGIVGGYIASAHGAILSFQLPSCSHFASKKGIYSISARRLLDELSRGYPQPRGATVARMEYAKIETATLAHVDDSYYYGAYCRKCKHSARLSLSKLRAHLGETFPLLKIKDKLRCECCSSKQIVITFLAPDQ